MHATYSLLSPTPYSLLSALCSLLPTLYSLLPAPYSLLPTPCSLLTTHTLPTHHLLIIYSSPTHHQLIIYSPPTHHLLITYSPPTHHLLTTDLQLLNRQCKNSASGSARPTTWRLTRRPDPACEASDPLSLVSSRQPCVRQRYLSVGRARRPFGRVGSRP